MKRYYLDKLNIIESVIKAIIVNILITIFMGIVFLIAKIDFYLLYVYAFIIIYIIVLFVNFFKSLEKISFYIKDNVIIYCRKNKEIEIQLYNIELIEEYFGVNYLFGKKTIILHEKNKKYNFVLNKLRADEFKRHLENVINSSLELTDFNI